MKEENYIVPGFDYDAFVMTRCHRLMAVTLCTVLATLSAAGAPAAPAAGTYHAAARTLNATAPIDMVYSLPTARVQAAGVTPRGVGAPEMVVSMGNVPLDGKEGEPVLPVAPARIVLPAGQTLDTIEVVRGGETAVGTGILLTHRRPWVRLSGTEPVEDTPANPAIYTSDAPYPARPFELVTIQKRRGVSVAYVNLYPVEYRPASGTVTAWESMELLITTRPDTAASPIRYRPDPIRPLAERVDNPAVLATYAQRPLQSELRAKSICAPGVTNTYVVITSAAMINAATDYTIHDLVAAKAAAGVSTEIVDIDTILAAYTGVDNAQKLRNFIIDAYNTWDTDYVLLGGDTGVVPYRLVRCNGLNIPSDMYFQCLDGNYNHDGDSNWGEWNDGPAGGQIDLAAELYIGRASAETPEEMANVVCKTLAYAAAPASSPFLRKALIAGQYLGSNFGPGYYSYAKPRMEEIRLGASTRGYVTTGFVAYDGLEGTPFYQYDGTWNRPMSEALNSENYCILAHLGHGNTTYGFGMSSGTAANLQNDAFFFGIGQDCFSGDLDHDCLAEAITSSTRHGAVAVVLNSRYGLGVYCNSASTVDGPSQRVIRQFWDGYFGEGLWHFGALNADSHDDNIWCANDSGNRQCIYESNLFGDPHTLMRGISEEPVLAVVSNAINEVGGGDIDGFINPGESVELTVTVENITPFDVTNITATLSTTNTYITITDATAMFGDIPGPRITRTALDSFAVDVSSNCIPGKVPFTLTFEEPGGRSWEEQISLHILWSYRIGGHVTLDGNPLDGATVTYMGPYHGVKTTDPDGSFLIHGTEGIYWLDVAYQDYLRPATFSVSVPPAREDILAPFTTAVVGGHVYDASTALPVDGATITYSGPVTGAVQSAADGSYSISRVFGKVADVTLVASKPGVFNDSAPLKLTIPPGATGVDFQLDRSEIAVAPTSMAVTVYQDNVVNEPLRIYNLRGGPFSWSTYARPVSQPPPAAGGEILESVAIEVGRDSVTAATFDGACLWIGHGRFPASISCFRASDGECVNSFGLSGYDFAMDLAWDGAHLWVAADYEAKLLALDPETGNVLYSYDSPFPAYSGPSIAYGENALWLAHASDGTVHKLSPVDGSILDTFSLDPSAPRSVSDLGYFNGQLWYQPYNDTNLYAVSTVDGRLERTVHTAIGGRKAGPAPDDRSSAWIVDAGKVAHRVSMGTVTLRPSPNPTAGTVLGNSFVDTLCAFDTEGCAPGVYEAVLHILSDDIDKPDIAIPVTCTVLAQPPGSTNHAPLASNDVAVVARDGTVVINVLANDSDPDGHGLTLVGVGACEHGTASNLGASVRYTPPADWSGMDGFSYTVSDGHGGANAALVSVRVWSEGRIEGVVTAVGSGAPVDGAVVTYTGPLSGSAVTGPDGSYRIEGVDGLYSLVADKPNVYFPSDPVSVTLPCVGSIDFQIGAPEIDVNPTSIYVLDSQGCYCVRSVEVNNSGNQPLTWTLKSGVGHGSGTLSPVGAIDRSQYVTYSAYAGIASDGVSLWHKENWGIARYRLSDGVKQATIYVDGGALQPYGLTWGNSNLWTCGTPYEMNAQYLCGMDPSDGSLDHKFTMPTVRMLVWGMAYGEGSLWIHDHIDASVYRMDPNSGVIISAFTLPTALPAMNPDIAFYEGCLWMTSALDDGKLYKVSADGAYLGEFDSPIATARCLATDPSGLWILDSSRYAHHLGTGWVEWIDQNSRNGNTAASTSSLMQFGLNGDTAGVGVHTATLYIYANDIDEPVSAVPITFTVTANGNNDRDGDELPDDWEILNAGGTNAMPTGDADNDGLTTAEEYIAGTCPTDPDSCFLVEGELRNGQCVWSLPCIQTEGVPGYQGVDRYYALERGTNLLGAAWDPVPGFARVPATEAPGVVMSNTPPASPEFLRGSVWLESKPE